MDIAFTIAFIGLIAIITALAITVWFMRKAKRVIEQTAAQLAKRVTELERAAQVVPVVPLSVAFQSLLVKELTHYHKPEVDALLIKLGDADTAPTITDEEQVILDLNLDQVAKDPANPDEEREAAEMLRQILPTMVRRVKREAAAVAEGKPFSTTQTVGVFHKGEKPEEGEAGEGKEPEEGEAGDGDVSH